jgi:nucleolar protein 56
MRAYIVTTFIGSFALDENSKVISFRPFPKDPAKAAEKLKRSEMEVIDEEKQLTTEIWKRGYKDFIYAVRKEGIHRAEPGNAAETFVKENLRKLATIHKFVREQSELNQFLTRVNIEITKVKIKRAIGRDSLIMQAIGATDEIDKSVNILIERLREWYGLHFPEMDRIIANHEAFAKIVANYGTRENIEDEQVKEVKEKSMGIDLTEEDIKTIQELAKQITELYALRETIAKYIDKTLKEVAPNMREIAGPMLAAKLIAKGGGLEKLAKSASSKLQLLGAEKALFRFLHGKGKSPKFGIIFSHPLIQNAPLERKGKIARVLAAKLSLAAKIDFYSHEDRSEKIKKELNEKVKEVLSAK